MLHEIGRELEAALIEKGCPFKVKDREAYKPTAHRNVIVIEHTGGESFSPTTSQSENPKRYYVRNVGAKLTIYAQSTKAGAAEYEHRRLAEQVLDIVLVELRRVCNVRRMLPDIGGGRFVTIEDLAASETQAGAAYELTFTVARAVEDKAWDGSLAPEFTVTAFAMSGAPSLAFAAAGDTITRDAGSWLDDGFAAEMTVRVTGTTSNNVTGELGGVTDLVLTFASTALSDEGPVSGCTVEAGGTTTTTFVSPAQGPDDDDDPATPPATAETV